MKFCHLHHSTVTLETHTHFFVFDWFQGEIPFPEDKKYVIIATHGHEDHYHPMIHDNAPANSRFLLSDDIETDRPHTALIPDESYSMDEYKITTFGSTDQGISLLVETREGSFFFSGDLNAWIWPEDEKEVQEKEKNDYLRELEKIKEYPVDLACVPADPRLGENYAEGVRLFDEIVNPRAVVPIHFRNDFDTARRLREKLPHTPIIQLKGPGDCVDAFPGQA